MKLIYNILEGRRLHFGHKSTQIGLFRAIMPTLIFLSLQMGGMRDDCRCTLSVFSSISFKSKIALTKIVRNSMHSHYLCRVKNNYMPPNPKDL